MKVLALCLLVCCCWLPSQRAEARRVLYAVTIGNNAPPAHESGLPTLRYADDDAVKWRELFAGTRGEAVLLALLDADTARRHPGLAARALAPSYGNLRASLARLLPRMREDRRRGDTPVLFLTFSGHGSEDAQGQPGLALIDRALTRALLYGELLPLLREVETHLIIDACRAASVVGMRGPFDAEQEGRVAPLAGADALLEAHSLAAFPNLGVLIAHAEDQQTHEWSRIEAGVFSHELISALRGAADVNGDLTLAYSEVRAFVAAANRDIVNPKARTQLIAHVPGRAEDAPLLALADLAEARILRGNPAELGHFHVEASNGVRLLDAHLAAGTQLTLALPSHGSLFVQRGDEEAELPEGTEPVRLAALRFQSRALAARGSVERELREALFASPYGLNYYRGFVDSVGLAGVTFGAAPVADAAPEPRTRAGLRRKLAIASAALGAAALIATALSTGLSVASKRDFEHTDQERRAHALRDAYQRRFTAALVTGGLFVAAGSAALALWPEWSPAAGLRAGVRASLRF